MSRRLLANRSWVGQKCILEPRRIFLACTTSKPPKTDLNSYNGIWTARLKVELDNMQIALSCMPVFVYLFKLFCKNKTVLI
jgi:hypothetical protein